MTTSDAPTSQDQPGPGRKVVVTGNTSGHAYRLGQVVTLSEHYNPDDGWRGVEEGGGNVPWWLTPEEFALLPEENQAQHAMRLAVLIRELGIAHGYDADAMGEALALRGVTAPAIR